MQANDKSPDKLSQQLVNRIKSGFYAPGQRLIESELMAEYGVGRSLLRETLKKLIGEGYLTAERNRGVVVRKFTRQEVLDRARVREVLEGLAARQAAERKLSAEDRLELQRLQESLDSAAKNVDIDLYAKLNEKFHSLILDFSGNEISRTLLDRLNVPIFRQQFHSAFTVKGIIGRNEDHQRISQAILDEAPDRAEMAMRAHIRHGLENIRTMDDDYYL